VSTDKRREALANRELLAERAAKLGELKRHPSWAVLKEILEAKKERRFAHFARELMAGREPVDQRKLDFERGFWAGITYILANPEHAEREFEKAVEKAERLKEMV